MAYSLSADVQREVLRGVFQTLSQDDTPMVRRAAAQCLGPLAEVADAHTLSSTIAPTFLKLTQDGACRCLSCLLVLSDGRAVILPGHCAYRGLMRASAACTDVPGSNVAMVWSCELKEACNF